MGGLCDPPMVNFYYTIKGRISQPPQEKKERIRKKFTICSRGLVLGGTEKPKKTGKKKKSLDIRVNLL